MNVNKFVKSIGKHALTTKFIDILLEDDDFAEMITPFQINNALIISLLSEIGTYPYSDLIHKIMKTKQYDPMRIGSEIIIDSPISNIISNDWNLEPEIISKKLLNIRSRNSNNILLHPLLIGRLSIASIDNLYRMSYHGGLHTSIDITKILKCIKFDKNEKLIINQNMIPQIENYFLSYYHTFSIINSGVIQSAQNMLMSSFYESIINGFDYLNNIEDNYSIIQKILKYSTENKLKRSKNILQNYSDRNIYKNVYKIKNEGQFSKPIAMNLNDVSKIVEDEISDKLKIKMVPGSIIYEKSTFPFDNERILKSDNIPYNVTNSENIKKLINRINSERYCYEKLFVHSKIEKNVQNIGEYKIGKILENI